MSLLPGQKLDVPFFQHVHGYGWAVEDQGEGQDGQDEGMGHSLHLHELLRHCNEHFPHYLQYGVQAA